MSKMVGKVSIVTGAARGIGAAAAIELAKEGADVVLVDVLSCEQTKETIANEVGSAEVVCYEVDVKNRDEVEGLMKAVNRQFGRIDVVVNNAGTCCRYDLESMTDEMWHRDIDTNLRGTFLMTQTAIYPYMKQQGNGKIINISSISGIMGGPFAFNEGERAERSGPAYAASKGGVIAFTRWVAKEVGRLGITCNSIAPGPVATEITKGMNYPLANQVIQRMGTPEDIAAAVVYLASPQADYVTGEVLKVCGGSAIG
ncbi:3-oxoacyl-ACP reductase [Niallia circulans]|uniref:SDR family NAD(P)-dependent oxidoreductase n=1 Tax=Shouchella clausii TaxID=79880 RepID=UPI000BA55587|nr:SDR family oxidoreductase [Shouchella clausii]MCM3548526.1 SDR family oxidoreductase [Shouchella clausii]PAF13823.1 3-oxoacyl-ACP reductase [Shouchella clausii]SPT78403.1 3-oxoacyl-ACP reductase [Niallia circulans]